MSEAPVSLDRRMRRLSASTVETLPGRIRIRGPAREGLTEADDAGARAALSALSDWVSPRAVFAAAVVAGGPAAGRSATGLLRACQAAGVLEEALFRGAEPVLRALVTPGSGLGPPPAPAPPDPPFVWTPGVRLTPEGGGWRIETPLAPGHAWVASALLADPLQALSGGWKPDGEDHRMLAGLLADCGLVLAQSAPAMTPALPLSALALHASSRRGSSALQVGATGRDAAHLAPPARRPAQPGYPLPRPDPRPLPTFERLLATRRSHRPGRSAPGSLSLADLGALLWISARDLSDPWRDADGFERLSRPYPSAGGCHELELYVALADPPAGLPAFGRYDAAGHSLQPAPGPFAGLLTGAGHSMGGPAPAALIILSARFGRVSWKYGEAGYPLILKDAGVLLQTLHLTCTALGLGSCILGGGDNRSFARATGLDPCQDGPVGEIAVTGRMEGSPRMEEAQ